MVADVSSNRPAQSLFGERLRDLRLKRDLSQSELARLLGLAARAYISNLEAGRKMPSLDLAMQIAELFGVTTDYLLRDTVLLNTIPNSNQ
jgi:transcriptional regulator with XRE-family HTH domain